MKQLRLRGSSKRLLHGQPRRLEVVWIVSRSEMSFRLLRVELDGCFSALTSLHRFVLLSSDSFQTKNSLWHT